VRVLVLGTAGTEKHAYIEAVGSLYLKNKQGLDPASEYARRHLRVAHVERLLQLLHDDQGTRTPRAHHITTFLDLPSRRSQLGRWAIVVERLLSDIGDFGRDESEVHFLLMNGEYFRRRQLFSCFSWDHLLRYGPDVIVTLIDDVYDVRARINAEEALLPTKSEVTLDDVLLWRAAEINLGDELAHNLYLNADRLQIKRIPRALSRLFRSETVRHYVVSIKHQASTLYKLLFEPRVLSVYASFPITSTRHVPDRVTDINRCRHILADKFAVLDPVTIDELRIEPKADAVASRWPLNWPSDVPEIADSLTMEELNRCKDVIASQIEERDYRLVDTCDCVAAFRPFYGRRDDPAHGVEAEIGRAFTGGREKVIFHHPDDGSLEDLRARIGVLDFITKVKAFDNFEDFVRHLEQLQEHSATGGRT
jgi:hypothetical protein